jgi:hypothetical protein
VSEVFREAQGYEVVKVIAAQGLEGVSDKHAGVSIGPERQPREMRSEALFLVISERDNSNTGVTRESRLNGLNGRTILQRDFPSFRCHE